MTMTPISVTATASDALAQRIRMHLQQIALHAAPITYHMLARALGLVPPNTIHQVTEALERLMEEDAESGHPFIAALVISRIRNGLPAPGFFDCAKRLGRFDGNPKGPETGEFHRTALRAAVAFWSAAAAAESEGLR